MPFLYVSAYALKQHLQAADETLDSAISSGLVPWDGVQGTCQRSTRRVQNIHPRTHGIREERHEGQSVKHLKPDRAQNSSVHHQSGEGFSPSIASDCLSRLEGDEQASFSEEVIREVSGMIFVGESLKSPRQYPHFSIGHRCSRDGASRKWPRPPLPR